ncbi:hypothetical protein ABIG06_003657 [Bradyrhizobium sp. USDA 326]
MYPSPRRLNERVNYLVRLRRLLAVQAAAFTLAYYRRHRRMPPGYVLRLFSSATVHRIRLRAELEILLGIPSLYRFSRLLYDCVIDRCHGSRDVRSRR